MDEPQFAIFSLVDYAGDEGCPECRPPTLKYDFGSIGEPDELRRLEIVVDRLTLIEMAVACSLPTLRKDLEKLRGTKVGR